MQKENTHLKWMYEINKERIQKNKLFQSNKHTFQDPFQFSSISFRSLPFPRFFRNWRKKIHTSIKWITFQNPFTQIINNNMQICNIYIYIYQKTIECVVVYHSKVNPSFVLFLFLSALLNFKGFFFFKGNLVQNRAFFRFLKGGGHFSKY